MWIRNHEFYFVPRERCLICVIPAERVARKRETGSPFRRRSLFLWKGIRTEVIASIAPLSAPEVMVSFREGL